MLSFRRLCLAPWVGASHDCRKMFRRARCEVPGGAALLIIKSVSMVQVGCERVRFRYDFSHMISMASFLAWMFSRFRPPSLRGWHRKLRVILGDESSSHIKSRISLVRAVSTEVGIPCAWVRNWVWPHTMACTMVFLPKRVGLPLPHWFRSFLMRSRIGSQGVVAFVWFPIHALRERMALPSEAIWIWLFMGDMSSWFIFRVAMTIVL
jgi:hypothetical protein